MTVVKNPHNSLFRNVLSDRTAAADFLRNFLPQEILQAVNISSLDIAKDTFITRTRMMARYPILQDESQTILDIHSRIV